MAVQAVAAPVMMIGNATMAVVKTASTVAMKAGTAVAKAGVSSMKATGSALRTSVTTAGKASRGLLTSMRSSPLASRFTALSRARGGAARMAPQSVSRAPRSVAPKSVRRTPVSQAIERGINRSAARQRMQMARQSHASDERHRQIMRRLMQVNGGEDVQVVNPFIEIAKSVRDKVAKTISAVKSAALSSPQNRLAMQVAQKEHETKTSPSMER